MSFSVIYSLKPGYANALLIRTQIPWGFQQYFDILAKWMIVWVRNGEYFSVSSTVPNNPTVYTPVEPSVAKHQQIYLTVPFSPYHICQHPFATMVLLRWDRISRHTWHVYRLYNTVQETQLNCQQVLLNIVWFDSWIVFILKKKCKKSLHDV